ncbi:hypothetical protein PGO_125340 [Plasmodium gonderi]|uniref:MFS-type transporter n=1 Tax=Plasmodium gonderi TaxID=77519 RepID=A0A1Y1JJ64_PLAGO|nr:hypothetical protein PGO_125340 [Plasmodium gonderi]GAW82536.1 hypothetical protein PGO_125340 [Plasmodium gonderi]
MLFFFSYCCMVDNMICFTFAPINKVTYKLYGISNNIFPQVYFIIYSIFSIPLSFLLSKFSLRSNVVCSSLLQFIGCLLRYIYWENLIIVMLGQFISSIGQIIFVNAPPEVSLVWFPEKERIISTSISIISNVLGTAIIYLYAPLIVINEKDLQVLLSHTCFVSFIGCMMVTLGFENSPPPPSCSCVVSNTESLLNMEFHPNMCLVEECQSGDICYLSMGNPIYGKNENIITKFAKELRRFLIDLKVEIENILKKEEIIKILIIFCYSECLISSFSADMSTVLNEKLISKNYYSLSGSLFICSTIVGSALLCFNANSNHFKKLIIICIGMIMFICILLYMTNHPIFIILTISLIGFWSGPLQPICVEMASIRVYPINSNLCTSILQVISFSVSALFISFFSYISAYASTSIFIFFFSFIMFLISLNLKPVIRKEKYRKDPSTINNISFSFRSGLINRSALIRTHKNSDLTTDLFDDMFNDGENDENFFEGPLRESIALPIGVLADDASEGNSECSRIRHSWDKHCEDRCTLNWYFKTQDNFIQLEKKNIFIKSEMKNLPVENHYRIKLNRSINLDNLKRDLFFYNQKVESPKGKTKSYSKIYCDAYNAPFSEEKMHLSKYNTY